MTKPTFVTDDVPTATEVNEFMVNINTVIKAATESVTSSTTLQNDDELFTSVLASATYRFTVGLKYDGPQLADLKFAFTVPAGATANAWLVFLPTSTTTGTDPQISGGDVTASNAIGTNGSGTSMFALFEGILVTAGAAGTFQFQWAQSTSNVTATRVLAGSWLDLKRVS
jgi:ABC-type uncharacterized transport system permease subunit